MNHLFLSNSFQSCFFSFFISTRLEIDEFHLAQSEKGLRRSGGDEADQVYVVWVRCMNKAMIGPVSVQLRWRMMVLSFHYYLLL